MTDDFYLDVLRRLIAEEHLKCSDRVLVVAGGTHDCDMVRTAGLEQVMISNLDTRMDAGLYAPFEWSFQDAEALTFEDASFDWCIEHNGLHHCHSPHRALLEMYRVARRGILFFEPYDNMLTRLGVRMGFGQDFEHAAVYYNGMEFGGVRNTEIPNFVYRWTRREIEKTILSNAPYGHHEFTYVHQFRLPWGALRGRKNPAFYWLTKAAVPFFHLLQWLVPTQSNCFAAMILKPDTGRDLYPWLQPGCDGKPKLNRGWLEALYKPGR